MVRYVKGSEIIERLVSFFDCESTTGESICEKVFEVLKRINASPTMCRAQTYDGAGNMAGRMNGCAAHFMRQVPEAIYYHCASHQLNLVLSKTAQISEVQAMLGTLTSVGLFYKYSRKRQRQLEKSIEKLNDLGESNPIVTKAKVKTMCQTRWVERHTSMLDFDSMYHGITDCLQEIAANREMNWDGKAVTEAQGLLHNIRSSGFIACFKVNHHMFGYTKPLSCLLQGTAMDVITAYNEIKTIKKVYSDMRADPRKEFEPIYKAMCDMAGECGITVSRICGRQTSRSNVEASTPEEYWRRTIFIPFFDHLIQAFSDRFSQLNEDAIRGFKLLPSNVSEISSQDIDVICQRFKSDLPSPDSFTQELRRWKLFWCGHPDPPSSLELILTSPLYSPKSYPNISTVLHILSVTPVTSATSERANSALKVVKSDRRSTMGQDG